VIAKINIMKTRAWVWQHFDSRVFWIRN